MKEQMSKIHLTHLVRKSAAWQNWSVYNHWNQSAKFDVLLNILQGNKTVAFGVYLFY